PSWSYRKNVVKYGYNMYGGQTDSDTSGLTTEDGTVKWVVTVVLDPSTSSEYIIKDTLPVGVTLANLVVSSSTSGSTKALYPYYETTTSNGVEESSTEATTENGIEEGTQIEIYDGDLGVSYTLSTETDSDGDHQVITINADFLGNANASSITFNIIYTCQMDDTLEGQGAQSLTNEVNVSYSDGTDTYEYGSDSQTTSTEWTSSGTSGTKALDKDSYFDTTNSVIKYTLTIPGYESDDVVLTDVISYNSYPKYGIVRSANLRVDSMKIYYNNSNLVKDDTTGEITAGDVLDSSEYSWTLDKEISYDWEGNETIVQTITLNLPPSTTGYVFAYEYKITIIVDSSSDYYSAWLDGDGTGAVKANAQNYAYLEVDGVRVETSDTIKTENLIEKSEVSGNVRLGSSYTIYKVDNDNFSTMLSGATFDLYVYNKNATPAGFEKVTSITTVNGTASISGSVVYLDGSGNEYTSNTNNEYDAYYRISDPNDSSGYIYIPTNTLCYFVESSAPTDYQLVGTKYYFYYGESVATLLSSVAGYTTDVESASNLITGNTEYIKNSHTADYYSEKAKISVIKSWTNNAEDPDDTYEKTDDSLKFTLYRVRYDNDGNYVKEEASETTTEEETQGETVSAFNWAVNNQYDSLIESGTKGYYANTKTVKIAVVHNYAVNTWGWYPGVTIKNGNGDTLVSYSKGSYSAGTNSGTYSGEWVGDSGSGGTFNVELPLSECTSGLTIKLLDSQSSDYSSVSFSLSSSEITTTVSTTAETTTETTTETTQSTESTSEAETETTTTVLYYHVFADDEIVTETYTEVYTEVTTDDAGNITGYSEGTEVKSKVTGNTFNNDYKDYKKITDSSQNFFSFYGALTDDHGSVTWDTDGDGNIEILSRALKMQTNVDSVIGTGTTQITFTSKAGGMLTMVFTTETSSDAVVIYSGSTSGSSVTKATSNNVLSCYLEAGTYIIQKSKTSYVAFISFEEGAGETSDDGSSEVLNFDSGTTDDFFKVSGSTTNTYGTVDYVNYYGSSFSSSSALKMDSTTSITFKAEEAGHLHMVFTNPKSASVVGATIDGTQHKASVTTTTDSNGRYVYVLTVYLEAGSHTIKRIGSVEYLLYYIQFVADDYGSGEWKELSSSVTSLGIAIDTFTISYGTNWRWTSDSLPSQWINEETGEVLGYYEYYVVEETRYDPQDSSKQSFYTLYMNNEGITSGTIKVSNRINPTTSGVVGLNVTKEWYEDGKQLTGDDIAKYSVDYTLFRKVILLDSSDNTTGGAYSANFDTTSSSYFTIKGNTESSSSIGTAAYNGTTYSNTLVFDSSASIAFNTLAANGTLTLVFSKYLMEDYYDSKSSVTSGVTNYVTADGKNYYSFTDSSGNLGSGEKTLYVYDSSSGDYVEWEGTDISITYYAYFNYDSSKDDESYSTSSSYSDGEFYGSDTVNGSFLKVNQQYTNSISGAVYQQRSASDFNRSDGNNRYYTLVRKSGGSSSDATAYTRIRNYENTSDGGTIVNLWRSTDGSSDINNMKDLSGKTLTTVIAEETDIMNSRAYYIKTTNSGGEVTYTKTDGSFYTLETNNTIGYAFTLKAPDGTVYQYIYDPDSEVLTVTEAGKTVFSGDVSDCSSTYLTSLDTSKTNCIIFEVPLSLYSGDYDDKGYTVSYVDSGQCYLYYAEYFYTYSDVIDGISVGSGTLDSSNNWYEEWEGLTYPVYYSEGKGTIIGYYSYYIVETDVTGDTSKKYTTSYSVTKYTESLDTDLADIIDGYLVNNLKYTYDDTAGTYTSSDQTVVYTKTKNSDGDVIFTDSSGADVTETLLKAYLATLTAETDSGGGVTYSEVTKNVNGEVTSSTPILYVVTSNGTNTYYNVSVTSDNTNSLAVSTEEANKISSFTITNTVDDGIVLPVTGGDRGFKYILAGTLTSLAAILLLYKRRKGFSAGL
ncbi:MAG: LPXTG cell wall anchor domain-containing protein, partial [Clostridiales bacterium]|nr:LPXTG cell wall anchor domain-containing protein [Clostridiales bacterium]